MKTSIFKPLSACAAAMLPFGGLFAASVGLTLSESDKNVDWDSASWVPQAPSSTDRDAISIGADSGVSNAGVTLATDAIGETLDVRNGVLLGISGSLNLTGNVNLYDASRLTVDGGSLVIDDGDASTGKTLTVNNGSLKVQNGATLSIDGRIDNGNSSGSVLVEDSTVTGSVQNFRNFTVKNSTFNANTEGDIFRAYNAENNLTIDNSTVNGRKSDGSGWAMAFFVVGNQATITMKNGSVVSTSSHDFNNPTAPDIMEGATNDIGWSALTSASDVIRLEVLSGSKYSERTIRLGREASGTSSTDGKFEFVVRGDHDASSGVTRTSEIAAYEFNIANDALAVADSKLAYDVRFEGYTNSVFQNLNLANNTGMRSGSVSFVVEGVNNSIRVYNNLNMNGYAGADGSTFKNTMEVKGGTTLLVDNSTFLGTEAGTAGDIAFKVSGSNDRLDLGDINLRASTAEDSQQRVSFSIADANAVRAANSNGDSRSIWQGSVAGVKSGYTEVIMNSSSGVGGASLDGNRWFMGSTSGEGGYNYAEIRGVEGALNRLGFYAIVMRNSTSADSQQVNRMIIDGYTKFGDNTTMGDTTFRPQVASEEASASGLSEFIVRGKGNDLYMWQLVAGNEASTGGIGRVRIEGGENRVTARANLIIRGGVGTSRDNIVGGVLELAADANGLPGIDSDRVYFTGVLVLDFSGFVVNDPDRKTYTYQVLRSGFGWNGDNDSTLIDGLLADSATDNNDRVSVIKRNDGDEWRLYEGENNWLMLEYTAIPEPSVCAAILGAFALALAAYRRRR